MCRWLDVAGDVGTHTREGIAHQFDGRGGNARKRFLCHPTRKRSQFEHQWLALARQMEPPRAPILGIAAALDQPRFLEPVENPAQGDRLDIEMIGELDLT